MRTDNLVELEAFFPDIEPELPRCPIPVIEARIRDSIIDACERANIWRWEHPEIQLIAGQRDYDLMTPTADTLVHSVIGVSRNGLPVSGDDGVTTHGDVGGRGFTISERGQISLLTTPLPSQTPQCMELLISIKPSRTTLEVPAVLVRDYYQLIRYGALARAMMMVNRPWTNPEVGKEMEKQYEFALGKAKQGIDRGFRTGSQRIKPRRFA